MKTVFCPLGAVESDTRLDALVALCKRHDAHLSVLLFAVSPPVPVKIDFPAGEDWTTDVDHVREQTRAHVRALTARFTESGVSVDVRTVMSRTNRIQHLAGINARMADVTVATNSLRGAIDIRSPVVYGCLFESGRPLLVEPNIDAVADLTFSPARVAIAWNGRMQASRAVACAINMLITANEVDIVSVDAQKRDADEAIASSENLRIYLARYGIKAHVSELRSNGEKVDAILDQHARKTGVDLLVMGAYGHSRIRERLFGGTTRAVLGNASVPVFMAH